jgi:hypothetical protein
MLWLHQPGMRTTSYAQTWGNVIQTFSRAGRQWQVFRMGGEVWMGSKALESEEAGGWPVRKKYMRCNLEWQVIQGFKQLVYIPLTLWAHLTEVNFKGKIIKKFTATAIGVKPQCKPIDQPGLLLTEFSIAEIFQTSII